MQKTEEEQGQKESYRCPNPNCDKVFSRPKLIKYYVCPSCQALVKMDTSQGNAKTKKRRPTEAEFKRKEEELRDAERKAEKLESELKAERLEAQTTEDRLEAELESERNKAQLLEAKQLEAEQKAEQLETKQKEAEERAKLLEKERLEAQREIERKEAERLESDKLEAERKQVEKQQQVESEALNLVEPLQTEQQAASKEAFGSSSAFECKNYFGYLGQREKGEGIPAECLECPKSLDCMLLEYKSKESVAAIKKWYPLKT